MAATQGLIRLNLDLLKELGYAQLTAAQGRTLLRELYETIEVLVGSTLANGLTDSQLSEFEKLIDGHDDAAAERWLQANRPDYAQVARNGHSVVCEVLRALAAQQSSHDNLDLGGPGGAAKDNDVNE